MYCNYCGKSIQDDANVCAYCGTRVSSVVARQRLVRPRNGRKIAGVCLGVAEYFDIDPTLVRLVLLVLIFGAGTGLLAYIVGWIVIPEEPYLLTTQASITGQQQVTNP
jgi:phage shock protein C